MPTIPQEENLRYNWRFRVNLDVFQETDLLHRAMTLFEIKTSIVGGGTGWTDRGGASITMTSPWSVVASSDGVAASASDRWVDNGDLVWATSPTARSWCLLRHDDYFGTSDPLELLIECSQASSTTRNATVGLFLSRDGFDVSSPSTTARPTATDEIEVCDDNGDMTNAAWIGSDTNDEDHRFGRLHFLMSDDGRAIIIAFCRDGACVAFWHLFRMDEWMSTSMSHPVAMMVASSDTDANQLNWTDFAATNDNCQWYTRDDTVSGVARMRAQMPVSTASNTAASALVACNFGGGAYDPFLHIPLCGAAGVTGTTLPAVPDLWWTRAASDGESFPGDSSRQFQIFGIVVVPWNGSVAVLS